MNNVKNFSTPDELNKYLNTFDYGILTSSHKKIVNPDGQEFVKNYKTINPSDFFKYKIGVCWDFASAESWYFDKYFNFEYKTYYIELEDRSSTHTFLVYKDDDKYMYFESSYFILQGIHEFNNLKDIFRYILRNMNKDNYKYYIYEYKINKFNLRPIDYMNYIVKNGKEIEMDNILNENQIIIESASNKPERRYKCPYCEERYAKMDLMEHIEDKHPEMIPEGYSPARVVFNTINKKESGHCVMCHKETPFNDERWKYERICSTKCHDEYVKMVKARMKKKYGKEHLLDDAKQQEKMLANRSISGTYKFSDGGVRSYCGTYEQKLLEFFDKVLKIKSKDIMSPGPVVEYEFKGRKRQWITDQYYITANLVFDVKDGGDNPNNRNMEEYRAKQVAKEKAIKEQGEYNYIRLTNNDFSQLLFILAELKEQMLDPDKRDTKKIVNINEEAGMGALANCSDYEATRPCVVKQTMDNRFVGTALALDKYFTSVFKIKDKKLIKVDDPRELGECTLFEYNGNDYKEKVSEILEDFKSQKEINNDNYFYNRLTNKNTISENQIIFDECFDEILNGYKEAEIKQSIIENSLKFEFDKLNNNKMMLEVCGLEDTLKKTNILKGYRNIDIVQDESGYFGYNMSNGHITEHYTNIEDIPDYVLDILDTDF